MDARVAEETDEDQPMVRAGSRASVLALLIVAGGVNYLDRTSLSIAHGPILHEMHLTETQMGVLLSVFSMAYGCAQLPIGPLLDKLGARRVLGVGLGLWSLAQLMVSAVSSFGGFLGLRFCLGCGEAPYFPASIKVIQESTAEDLRGRATAAVNSSTAIAQAIAPPLLTAIMLALGWRWMFALSGAAGLVLTLVWLAVLRKEVGGVSQRTGQAISLREWGRLFRTRWMWSVMLGFGGVNYAAWFYIAWLPAYLQNGRGLSIARSGWLAALPFIAAAIGMIASGWLADRQVRSGQDARKVHLRHIVAGMAGSALSTLCVSRVEHAGVAVACICSALFCLHFAGNSGWGYAQAASPPRLVATVCSIQNFGSQVLGGLAPFLTGWSLDLTHGFASAFVLCAAVTLGGGLCYLSLARAVPPLLERG